MFEPYRKYSNCIFCGSDNLNREHLFGHALAQRLGIVIRWKAMAAATDEDLAKEVRNGSCPLTNVAPRLLCEECNGDRLSPSMQESLPYLAALCLGDEQLRFDESVKVALRLYFERFAMIVDVCTSDDQLQSAASNVRSLEHRLSAANRGDPPILNFATRSEWLAKRLRPPIDIYLGRHLGVLGLYVDMNVAPGTLQDNTGLSFTGGKRISVVLRNLAVCIDVGVSMGPVPSSMASLDGIHDWPLQNMVSYDDYFSLRIQDEQTLKTRWLLSDPHRAAQLEREWFAASDSQLRQAPHAPTP
jgi:hypothetical protein